MEILEVHKEARLVHGDDDDNAVPPQVLNDLAQALSVVLGSSSSSRAGGNDQHAARALFLATEEYDGEQLDTQQQLPRGLLGSQEDLVSISQGMFVNRPHKWHQD